MKKVDGQYTCTWIEIRAYTWRVSCIDDEYFIEAGLEDWKFCPLCGRLILKIEML